MNYIKALEQQVTGLAARAGGADRQITEMRIYLHGPKFRCGSTLDGYVNVKDVLNLLRNISNALHGGE